jgi:two-component system response regulator RegA
MSDSDQYLLIDDSESFAELLIRGFQRLQLQLDWAKNSEQALAKTTSYYGIILDLNLDSESGLRLLPKLVEHFPHSKIVILTGYASINTAIKAIKLGAVHYLPKPASVESILQAFNVDREEDSSEEEELEFEQPSLKRLTWEHIQFTLDANNGNISATARALGLHRRTLQRMLAKNPVKK